MFTFSIHPDEGAAHVERHFPLGTSFSGFQMKNLEYCGKRQRSLCFRSMKFHYLINVQGHNFSDIHTIQQTSEAVCFTLKNILVYIST